jgi:phosphoribosylformylglycinamidine synthase I
MAKPRVVVLRAPGSNCDQETAHAFSLAGAVAERWHVNRVLEEPRRLSEFQVLCVPGGFSYGDDVAAGRILGSQLQHHLASPLEEFRAAGKLIIGICNGFQVLLNTKLLDTADNNGPMATLTLNDSGRFEARWVSLQVEPGNCAFLQGMGQIELPVAHGEGKFVVKDPQVFSEMNRTGRFVLRYAPSSSATLAQTESELVQYPANPNGAMGNVAGICDPTGRVFGLMPHPERHVDRSQHPRWTREPERESGDGLRVFQNAVRYFQ